MKLGDKIKQLRVRQGLTQEEVAARCDLSKGFISQVERDLTSPSIATLVDILDCLGVSLKNFFSDDDERIVFDKDDIFTQSNPESGYDISWLIPNAQKNSMEPILLKISGGGRSDEYPPHNGEVFGYVLSGAPLLNLGSAKYRLKKGGSFYYKANSPYFIENPAKKEAVIIWVSTPPSF